MLKRGSLKAPPRKRGGVLLMFGVGAMSAFISQAHLALTLLFFPVPPVRPPRVRPRRALKNLGGVKNQGNR